MLVACGVVLAGLLLVVAINLDETDPTRTDPDRTREDLNIVEPGSLTEEEKIAGSGETQREELIRVKGGEIQITNEKHELAQRYRFTHLDPNPEGKGSGWLLLTDPVMEVYGSDGSVITLSGESAIAYAPNNAVESGTLTGNVVIHRYENIAGKQLDTNLDEPMLQMSTSEAQFDNIVGEVTCPGEILLETKNGEFLGYKAEVKINDKDDVISLLTIEKVDYVRIAAADAPDSPAPQSPTLDDNRVSTARHAGRSSDPTAPDSATQDVDEDKPGETRKPQAAAKPDTGSEAQVYRLTLHDNIKIAQGSSGARRTATGDSLSLFFSKESKGLGASLALAPTRRIRPCHLASLTTPVPLEQFMLSVAVASYEGGTQPLAPAEGSEDTLITCEGGLTMIPVANVGDRIASPDDALIELIGEPVHIVDEAAAAVATCAVLQHRTSAGRTELISSAAHRVDITSPEYNIDAERCWIAETEKTGGFAGPGRIRFFNPPPDGSDPGTSTTYASPDERLVISWADSVELTFGEGDESGALGSIKSALFRRDVVLVSEDLAMLDHERTDDASAPVSASRMLCDELGVGFATVEGEHVPRHILADGEVEIIGESQTLWTQSLDVLLRQAQTEDTASNETRTDVDRIVAENDVQLLMTDGQRVFGDRLEIDGEKREAVLTGEDVRLVDDTSVIDHARRIVVDDLRQTYSIVGKGRLRVFDKPVFADADGRVQPVPLDHLTGLAEELKIKWTKGVTVIPVDETGNPIFELNENEPANRIATFAGDVQVVSPEMKLSHADELRVSFSADSPDDSASGSMHAIDARGSVRAHSLGEPGEIACEDLHVDLAQNTDGVMVPLKMTATESVRVTDKTQTMWTDTLTLTFLEEDENEDEAASAVDGEFAGARVVVDTVRATGAVQIRLQDGERVFADSLEADPDGETASLFGQRIMVAGETFVLDHGKEMELNRQTGRYRIIGPGEFYGFEDPLVLPDVDEPIDLPDIDTERTLEATWTESALYIEATGVEPSDPPDPHSGTGSYAKTNGEEELELRGDVHAESRPNQLEHDLIDAESLTLYFADVETQSAEETSRELTHLLARGDAKLESRSWLNEDHSDAAKLFFVAGQHIDYDQRTFEATVIGDGELLIRDERAKDASEAAQESDAFSGKGTTFFSWDRQLHLTQVVDNQFNVEMEGNVRCVHNGLDERSTIVTGNRIEAVVKRLTGTDTTMDATAADGALDFGGSMEARRIYGEGGVRIVTWLRGNKQRDVVCDVFDYNLITGLAAVSANPGRKIYIQTAGSTGSMSATHILWNMPRDTITISRGSGFGAR